MSAADAATWRAVVLTLFPDLFPGPLGASLHGKALAADAWRLEVVNIRAFARDRHRSVDDQPFGGGPGMVMRADVLDAALAAVDAGLPTLYVSPRGRRLDQALVRELAAGPGMTVLCGRYEGVDQRVLEARRITEVSLGDFVLSGGEVAAMALIEACVRLLPGLVGTAGSLAEESFERGLLEYPHYTRPAVWTDGAGGQRAVPEVLLSGHHARVAAWRQSQAEAITRRRRPDLWRRYRAAMRKKES